MTLTERLSAAHGDEAVLFWGHQEALLERHIEDAKQLLERYREGLHRHMDMEESLVLPLYLERHGEVPGGTMILFCAEHRKLKQWLDRLLKECVDLGPDPRPAAILQLLEHEFRYKHLMDHHTTREETILYPGLDRVLTEAERTTLLSRIQQ